MRITSKTLVEFYRKGYGFNLEENELDIVFNGIFDAIYKELKEIKPSEIGIYIHNKNLLFKLNEDDFDIEVVDDCDFELFSENTINKIVNSNEIMDKIKNELLLNNDMVIKHCLVNGLLYGLSDIFRFLLDNVELFENDKIQLGHWSFTNYGDFTFTLERIE